MDRNREIIKTSIVSIATNVLLATFNPNRSLGRNKNIS